jgi:S1 RNA binding domain protein
MPSSPHGGVRREAGWGTRGVGLHAKGNLDMAEESRSQSTPALETGAVVEGRVTGITGFGAFIELPGGRTGLVHISEIANSYVTDIHQHLKEQEMVQVRIIGINEKGKYELSIRQVEGPAPASPPRGRGPRRGRPEPGEDNFEDKLSRFLKESQERQLDVRRNTDSKRGRGRR